MTLPEQIREAEAELSLAKATEIESVRRDGICKINQTVRADRL